MSRDRTASSTATSATEVDSSSATSITAPQITCDRRSRTGMNHLVDHVDHTAGPTPAKRADQTTTPTRTADERRTDPHPCRETRTFAVTAVRPSHSSMQTVPHRTFGSTLRGSPSLVLPLDQPYRASTARVDFGEPGIAPRQGVTMSKFGSPRSRAPSSEVSASASPVTSMPGEVTSPPNSASSRSLPSEMVASASLLAGRRR